MFGNHIVQSYIFDMFNPIFSAYLYRSRTSYYTFVNSTLVESPALSYIQSILLGRPVIILMEL